MNSFCKGAEIAPGKFSGCSCDCPACAAAINEVKNHTEHFFVTRTKDAHEACFLLRLNVGVIKPQDEKQQVTFNPETMVLHTRQALIAHISHRPSKNRNMWEDKFVKLTDMLVYWTMMARLGFKELPITATPEGKYFGHPLCESEKEVAIVVEEGAVPIVEVEPQQ